MAPFLAAIEFHLCTIIAAVFAFEEWLFCVYELHLRMVYSIADDLGVVAGQACSWCRLRCIEECFGGRAAWLVSGGCGAASERLACEFGLPLVACA
jgi:hypothetical protein